MIENNRDQNLPFRNFQPEKMLLKILGDLFRVKIRSKGAIMPFLDVRKSFERQASNKFYNKCGENSRSQIVFRTDIFRKLTLGVPEYRLSISSTHTFHSHALECHMSQSYCKLVG